MKVYRVEKHALPTDNGSGALVFSIPAAPYVDANQNETFFDPVPEKIFINTDGVYVVWVANTLS